MWETESEEGIFFPKYEQNLNAKSHKTFRVRIFFCGFRSPPLAFCLGRLRAQRNSDNKHLGGMHYWHFDVLLKKVLLFEDCGQLETSYFYKLTFL